MLQRYWFERLFSRRVVVSFRGGAIEGRALRFNRRERNTLGREEMDLAELVSYRIVATFSRRIRFTGGCLLTHRVRRLRD
jgi:hypothetical protein